VEVQAYRRRHARAETTLIVVIDADNLSVQDRLAQLDHAMDEAKADPIRPDAEQIARLVPKRHRNMDTLSKRYPGGRRDRLQEDPARLDEFDSPGN
jgi:hypothetical protein